MKAFLLPKIATVVSILLFTQLSFAGVFRNAYLSFELPPNWDCRLEGTEWVCISRYSQKSKEAIIILTAKEIGPDDSLVAYKMHLQQPKTLHTKSGKTVQSKVFYVKQRMINNHPWVDGHHHNSEVENYYTRYLATTKDKIAVVVTFSAHRSHYTKYSQDFMRAIQSLRVIPPKLELAGSMNPGSGGGGQVGSLGGPMGAPILPDIPEGLPEEEGGGLGDLESKAVAIAMILAAIGFYFLRKKKKRG